MVFVGILLSSVTKPFLKLDFAGEVTVSSTVLTAAAAAAVLGGGYLAYAAYSLNQDKVETGIAELRVRYKTFYANGTQGLFDDARQLARETSLSAWQWLWAGRVQEKAECQSLFSMIFCGLSDSYLFPLARAVYIMESDRATLVRYKNFLKSKVDQEELYALVIRFEMLLTQFIEEIKRSQPYAEELQEMRKLVDRERKEERQNEQTQILKEIARR